MVTVHGVAVAGTQVSASTQHGGMAAFTARAWPGSWGCPGVTGSVGSHRGIPVDANRMLGWLWKEPVQPERDAPWRHARARSDTATTWGF